MNLSKKVIGIGLGVVLSSLVISHDYSLYQKVKSTDQLILGLDLSYHGGSSTMRKQFHERLDKLETEKKDLLNETYLLKYLY